ncbi:MAG: hypothetical protein HC895_13325 [Leptolyngbyaceae cyanobacterium SM1_3_5]|nr:hypothetical protein [Leptolyngbyaceae cyanobacterium SM1_3_5]
MANETQSENLVPTGVQRDSETPISKKPSVLYIAGIVIGTLTIVLLAAQSYYNVAR